jgi:AcrR family transcriptional regulator
MTEKQEAILSVALRLFAEQGYDSTPTSQIAREAGVSEGLVFRHFINKEGLLMAVMAEGQERIRARVEVIERETDPRRVLALLIETPAALISEAQEFWALQTAMKFRSTLAMKVKQQGDYFGKLPVLMAGAFAALGYQQPDRETELLTLLLEGLGTTLMTQPDAINAQETVQFIKSKYQV